MASVITSLVSVTAGSADTLCPLWKINGFTDIWPSRSLSYVLAINFILRWRWDGIWCGRLPLKQAFTATASCAAAAAAAALGDAGEWERCLNGPLECSIPESVFLPTYGLQEGILTVTDLAKFSNYEALMEETQIQRREIFSPFVLIDPKAWRYLLELRFWFAVREWWMFQYLSLRLSFEHFYNRHVDEVVQCPPHTAILYFKWNEPLKVCWIPRLITGN